MGTWDIGPFDNDTAADFADSLDEAQPGQREGLIRGVLNRTLTATDYLHEAQEAVAAAALIASQCPTGQPVDSGYGPQSMMPELPQDLRALADEVLAKVTDDSGLVESWVNAGDGTRWLAMINGLRRILNPLPTTDVPLFDLDV
ncbi:DUF4259 domain-containing protein [Streptacidiphilus neutrinimicus]|uniref:DUF4259 domain-containing protein n=1 Tax=Streptacidiphilus neutrinimicus TaxID=105420 RepID=UPI0005A8AD65|nr:DUF4259 domain-containing protein [Streptacidiphilus neutrinimicus]